MYVYDIYIYIYIFITVSGTKNLHCLTISYSHAHVLLPLYTHSEIFSKSFYSQFFQLISWQIKFCLVSYQ